MIYQMASMIHSSFPTWNSPTILLLPGGQTSSRQGLPEAPVWPILLLHRLYRPGMCGAVVVHACTLGRLPKRIFNHLLYSHNLSYHDLLSTACNIFWCKVMPHSKSTNKQILFPKHHFVLYVLNGAFRGIALTHYVCD